MGTVLEADDLRVGMAVTVHGYTDPPPIPGVFAPNQRRVARILPPGLPLKVVAVNRPFVIVTTINGRGEEQGPVIVDLRDTQLMRVNGQYKRALKRWIEKNKRREAKAAPETVGGITFLLESLAQQGPPPITPPEGEGAQGEDPP